MVLKTKVVTTAIILYPIFLFGGGKAEFIIITIHHIIYY